MIFDVPPKWHGLTTPRVWISWHGLSSPCSGRRGPNAFFSLLHSTGILSLWFYSTLPFLSACTPAPQPTPSGITRSNSTPKELSDRSRPLGTPAQSLTRTSSQLSVSIRPLGSVPFDGITLPLTSPNGRFIAAQHGPIPSWDAILASPTPAGSVVPVQLRLSAYEVLPALQTPRDGNALRQIAWPSPPPRGLLIGRSCDDAGFLFEYPRPQSGSRWIGKLGWESGDIQWLVAPTDLDATDTAVSCFATLGPSGELAFCRAATPGKPFSLVVRRDPGDAANELTLAPPAGATFAMPTYAADSSRLYVYLISALPGTKLALLSIAVPSDSAAALTITARVEFNAVPSIDAAYHATAPLQTPWPVLPSGGVGESTSFVHLGIPTGIAIVSPESGSMCWYDGLSATTHPLARATLGASPLLTRSLRGDWQCSGLLLGAAGELVYQTLTLQPPDALAPHTPEFGADTALLKGAYLPRLTTARREGSLSYLLLTPPMPSAAPEVGCCELTPLLPR